VIFRAQAHLLVALNLLMSAAALAQTPPRGAPPAPPKTTSLDMLMQPPPAFLMPVQGAPYSLTRQWQIERTLADGTHLSNVQVPSRMYRDSFGRTRSEIPLNTKNSAIGDLFVIEIRDDAAGFAYILDTQSRIAHRYAIRAVSEEMLARMRAMENRPAPDPPNGIIQPIPDPTKPQRTVEKLGLRNIENIDCEQTRTTVTYPVGWNGNDRPLVSVEDSCESSYLHMSVFTKRVYEPMGVLLIRLTNISLLNPDQALFQVPPNYTVVDEKGPVVIKYTYPVH
jgi:hypothetical protein